MISLLAGALLGILTAAGSHAETQANPYTKPDRSWISLSGHVVDTSPERFRLDYGEGLITVEMDDWDWYDEAQHILPGDRVTVYGRIDDDLYEKRTIEADSVFSSNHNTFYYASDADEEDLVFYTTVLVPDGARMSVSGTVEKIDGREFVLDTGHRSVRVDTIALGYNPLDDAGAQKIEKGDRLLVSGVMDIDFFEKREIQADSIVTLSRDAKKKMNDS